MTGVAALWILGILLALILLLLLLRVGVHVRFGDALCVTAMAGPVRLPRTAGTVGVPEAGAAENPEASAHRPHAAFGVLRRR